MSIWKIEASLEQLNQRHRNTLAEHLEIKIVELGDDFMKASMPVDNRTHQPRGILHGGASVVLAESVGSFAANLVLEDGFFAVGLDINANHIKMVRSGLVIATATPAHLGRSTQVWDIRIHDEADKLVCVSRLTMAVLPGESK